MSLLLSWRKDSRAGGVSLRFDLGAIAGSDKVLSGLALACGVYLRRYATASNLDLSQDFRTNLAGIPFFV